eukprot:TRINITY_DN4319_c0_g1_i1.p1 TRINITY_DN4319_c0_g1~~TRINITY_DN4319_c0_g1_i1.p1  ORF type:complete len:122 (-),score=12.79 TRINITY_DN4319_c0_g1_i1:118-483(-)
MAPEVLNRSGHGKATDWWTLGVFAYELVSGQGPFKAPSERIIYEKIQLGKVNYPPFLSQEIKSFISRFLKKYPSERLGSMDGDEAKIKDHEWFKSFDWDSFSKRQLKAPQCQKVESVKNPV